MKNFDSLREAQVWAQDHMHYTAWHNSPDMLVSVRVKGEPITLDVRGFTIPEFSERFWF